MDLIEKMNKIKKTGITLNYEPTSVKISMARKNCDNCGSHCKGHCSNCGNCGTHCKRGS